ncbi:MAG: peptide ABC transporter substrate-binding protein [Myxococcales bacterium]|nr:peptide ABC transporter substrate-binding protein [Myxococcales bacterium]
MSFLTKDKFLEQLYRAFLIGPLLLLQLSCVPAQQEAHPGYMTVSVEQKASWTKNFNPLSAASGARWPTQGGIYEPLMIFNSMQDTWVPWLGTSFQWSEDNMQLRYTIRQNVRWSDGQTFSAEDVVFTFQLLKQFPALDAGGVWKFLDTVVSEHPQQVSFRFKKRFVPGLRLLAHQPIVPKHVWGSIENPVAFANPNPVATGPFTQVERFENQIYTLGKNPHYWNADKINIEGLRFPAYPGNEQANLALLNDEIDWAGNFVPAIDRIFVQKDPKHHHYWFPLVGTMVFLYLDTAQPPFNNLEIRKALSHAIDRDLMVKVAMYNYTKPAYPTGLTEALKSWRNVKAAASMDWMSHDPQKARSMLAKQGYEKGRDGTLRHPQHGPLQLEVMVVSGWSDWVRACQVIVQNLKAIGIDARVKTYEFGTWFEKMQKGHFQGGVAWSTEGDSPYSFYKWLMSPETVKPKEELATANWHRFGTSEVLAPLKVLETDTDPQRRHEAGFLLQELFAKNFPAIPLFANPAWGAFNSKRFEGFPTKEHPYARLSPNALPEALLVLTQVKTKTKSEPSP